MSDYMVRTVSYLFEMMRNTCKGFTPNTDNDGQDQIAHAQSDQGLGCPYTETMAIEEYIDGQRRP